ncbi:uncharacterized protein si:ch211-269k10.4 isoform X2 [Labrus bergylta]|uniref:uncharacterized protein si:ch211-269k10.4 isoform X2 n=1 Tax=Labrus bergylta TaxID=56723 RepID=UPI003313AA33
MACASFDMDIQGAEEELLRAGRREPPILQYYQATAVEPDVKGPLHDLLQKQPAVLGMVTGLLSLGMGFVFATTQTMDQSLFTLFRVSHLTGIFFLIAGLITNLLFKYPELVHASLRVNCGCIIVAFIAACLISVDLAKWKSEHEQHLMMEVLELCVLGLEVFLSAVLCFWFLKEKRS